MLVVLSFVASIALLVSIALGVFNYLAPLVIAEVAEKPATVAPMMFCEIGRRIIVATHDAGRMRFACKIVRRATLRAARLLCAATLTRALASGNFAEATETRSPTVFRFHVHSPSLMFSPSGPIFSMMRAKCLRHTLSIAGDSILSLSA